MQLLNVTPQCTTPPKHELTNLFFYMFMLKYKNLQVYMTSPPQATHELQATPPNMNIQI